MADDKALMLVKVVPPGTDLDKPDADASGWHASPNARLERLLREKGVATGLLVNDHALRSEVQLMR